MKDKISYEGWIVCVDGIPLMQGDDGNYYLSGSPSITFVPVFTSRREAMRVRRNIQRQWNEQYNSFYTERCKFLWSGYDD